MESKLLRLENIAYRHDADSPVFSDGNLRLGAGLCLLVGPNGCGKSTLLRVAAGVERPDSGRILLNGFDIWREEVAARKQLSYIPEHPDLTPYASVEEVLHLVCRLRGECLVCATEVLARAGLADLVHRSVRELSKGQRRRAMQAAAWIGSPPILLLDEPLETMDRLMREEILQWIEVGLTQGAAIVVGTHRLEAYVKIAASAVTIRGGTILHYSELPDDHDERLILLEHLSRGDCPI